jgi:hypothetical protein
MLGYLFFARFREVAHEAFRGSWSDLMHGLFRGGPGG